MSFVWGVGQRDREKSKDVSEKDLGVSWVWGGESIQEGNMSKKKEKKRINHMGLTL